MASSSSSEEEEKLNNNNHPSAHTGDARRNDDDFLETIEAASSSTNLTDLHRSNLLRQQADELVAAVSLNVSDAVNDYVDSISNLIESIGSPNESTVITNDPSCPFSLDSDQTTVALTEPLSVRSTGCDPVGLTQPAGNANVLPTLEYVVTIPNTVLAGTKDYLQRRYLKKRNSIVWHVAKYLSQPKFRSTVGTVYWRYWCHDSHKPVLLLVPPVEQKPKKKQKKRSKQQSKPKTNKLRFRVLLHFGMESTEWIPPLRLVPNRGNLSGSEPSQHYNHALTEDAAHYFLERAMDHDESFPHLNATVTLLKVWCLQRGLLRGHDTFTTTHLFLLVLYCYRTKHASPRMEAMQTLTTLFKLLADTDWLGQNQKLEEDDTKLRSAPSERYQDIGASTGKRDVLVLPMGGLTERQTIAESELAQLYERQTKESPLADHDPQTLLELYQTQYHVGPVFLDPTLTHNFFGRLSPSFMLLLQREARKSLSCLHSTTMDRPFDYLFLQNARFWKRYDAYLCIPIDAIQWNSANRADAGDYESMTRGMMDVLQKALGDRVRAMRLLSTGDGKIGDTVAAIDDSDEIPTFDVSQSRRPKSLAAPNGKDSLVLGVSLNPETCFRVVDRGPPAADVEATKAFVDLWGSKAELRRFKDGAIVHAVVWDDEASDDKIDHDGVESYIHFQNDDKVQGGTVERIIRHVLQLHFFGGKEDKLPQFSLRNMLSAVDVVAAKSPSSDSARFNPLAAQRKLMLVFDTLSKFLRDHSLPSRPGSKEMSPLGLPLAIDAVEALSPALRYAELFPPVSHPLLGGSPIPGVKKASGAVQSSPIEIQIRFGASSNWPMDLKAIGAAKTAMLIQLANGIESMKRDGIDDCIGFEGEMHVTPFYADVPFCGCVFRIFVRTDPELKLIRGLSKPTKEARAVLRNLTQRHVVSSMHHSLVHAVYSRHASSSSVSRMAKRWLASHLLSGLIPFEAIELMVTFIYSPESGSPLDVPGSFVAGFLRFLDLLANHDWTREPLIVDPQGSLSENDRTLIHKQFESARGPSYENGPPMYIVSQSDRLEGFDSDLGVVWTPTFTRHLPERVVLERAAALAQRSYDFLERLYQGGRGDFSAVFHETPDSFKSYSALLRVDSDFVVDKNSSSTGQSLNVRFNTKLGELETSYTRSMRALFQGPRDLQCRLFRNLIDQDETRVLLCWRPADEMIQKLRSQLGSTALFFYNELCPEVVGVVWRPGVLSARPFSVMTSRTLPVEPEGWKSDSLVVTNVQDCLREMELYTTDIVVGAKVFDDPSAKGANRKRKVEDRQGDSGSSGDSDDSNG